VPLAVVSHAAGLPVRPLLEAVLAGETPTLAWIRGTLAGKAREIQAGGSSYFADPEAGGLLWPADQHVLIRLVLEGRLADFYREAEQALRPFAADDETLADANLPEHYLSLLAGEPVPLEPGLRFYRVDRTSQPLPTVDAWCQHLVWCHGKDKRGYLHEVATGSRDAVAAA
jgi:hypothetical protein